VLIIRNALEIVL